MNEGVLFLLLLNFAIVGFLPLAFFRRDGRFNMLWWLTAAPFFLCVLFLIVCRAGYFSPLTAYSPAGARLSSLLAVPFSAASIALIFLTVGTHRTPPSLWHQSNDAPQQIVTHAAYRWIRHPFYAGFLLALLSAFFFCPHPGTLFSLIYGYLILNFTAAKEEARLQASPFGFEYAAYVQVTGRFVPRLRRHYRQSLAKRS
jgi:protein-S-isoprenylcysteine O-methyltransferase Ste14